MRLTKPKKRIIWVAQYLGTDINEVEYGYADAFCKKILPGFRSSGKIPKSKLKYVSLCSRNNEVKELRSFLKNIGIKHRVYRVYEGYEFLIRKTDYNLYRLTVTKDIFTHDNFVYDIDIQEMYERYKQYEKKLNKRK
jgi:hypothetical protein